MRALLASVGRGAGWKLGADLLGRALQYILLWAAARSLSRGDFGDFTFGLSIGYMLAQVADFGLQLYVQRELSRLLVPGAKAPPYFTDEGAAARLVGGGLALKGGLSVVALLLIAALTLVEPVGNKGALMLVGLSMVGLTGLDYMAYCFRALQRIRYEALATVLARGLGLLMGVGLLLSGAGVWGLAVAGNLAVWAALAFSYRQLRRYVRPVWQPDWAYWRRAAWQPTAVGLGIIFSIVSFRVDNLLIPPLVAGDGREALGLYNVAYKLFEPSLILPSVLLAVTFPLMSQAAKRAPGEAGGMRALLLRQTLPLLLALGAVASLGLALLAAPLISVLYGASYAASAPVLATLALACVPMFLNYGLTHALIAMDRPQLYAVFTLAALVLNVAANIMLIPALGIGGAALATVGTEALLLMLCLAAVLWLLRETPSKGIAGESSVQGSL